MDIFSIEKNIIEIYPDIYYLPEFTSHRVLFVELLPILKQLPPRQMQTPGGQYFSVKTTACGDLGWISDEAGYRYCRTNPQSGLTWPKISTPIIEIAKNAALLSGFSGFQPNSCLINCYTPGTQMGRHRDDTEQDLSQPVVSISLGMTASFQIFGHKKNGKPLNIDLHDGDTLVWGRSARLMYHAVKTIRSNPHSVLGNQRYNLTLRKA